MLVLPPWLKGKRKRPHFVWPLKSITQPERTSAQDLGNWNKKLEETVTLCQARNTNGVCVQHRINLSPGCSGRQELALDYLDSNDKRGSGYSLREKKRGMGKRLSRYSRPALGQLDISRNQSLQSNEPEAYFSWGQQDAHALSSLATLGSSCWDLQHRGPPFLYGDSPF